MIHKKIKKSEWCFSLLSSILGIYTTCLPFLHISLMNNCKLILPFLECYTDIFFPIFLDCALEKPFEISWGCKVVKWSKRSHLSVIMWCWPQDWQCRGRSNKGACHRSFLTYIVNVLFTVFLLCLLNVLLYN